MTSMIERVARAIGGEENGAPVDEPGERWRNWEPAARAAIAAMRDPTEGMVRAGGATEVAGFDGEDDRNMPIGEYEAEEAYRAMIDDALEEKP